MGFLLGAAFVIALLIIGVYLYIGWQLRVWPGK